MWISTLHLEPQRVLLTKMMSVFYPGVYYSALSPLQVRNLPRPPLPSPKWVRVRNRLAGICGSDLHLIFADADLRIALAALPGQRQIYPGHEVVGEVVEIGEEVQHLQVGDRVVLQNTPNCLSAEISPPCRACAEDNYNLCEQGILPGPQPIGGGWSEEMLLHEQQLFRLPEDFSDEQGVLLEPTAVAVHAVLRHLPRAGEQVLIIGAGTIGQLVLQIVCTLAPGAEVSIIARHASQIKQAARMGAAHIIDTNDTYARMQQITQAKRFHGPMGNQMLLGGYDVIYDTIGQKDTLHHALRWARAKGTIVLVGANLHMMHLDLTPLWYQEVNLLGTISHGMEIWPLGTADEMAEIVNMVPYEPTQQDRSNGHPARRSTFSIAAELMAQNRIHPEQLITHRFALSNYREALITAVHKSRSHAIKVIFDYALQPTSIVPKKVTARKRLLIGSGQPKIASRPKSDLALDAEKSVTGAGKSGP